MPIKRIHFIELNAKLNTLAVKRVFPKYGTLLLATILRDRGYDVRVFLEGVSDLGLPRLTDCDLVCMPVYAPAFNKVKALAAQLRDARPSLPIVMGGPQVALYPDTVAELADVAVRCEGDEVLPELCACLERGDDLARVAGISFRRADGTLQRNPDRAPPAVPATAPDLSLIEGLERAAGGLRGRAQVVNTLQTSRGCEFRCRFCPTSKLFGASYRNRDIDAIVADIRSKLRWGPLFFVVDNSFLSNRERTIALLRRLIREQLGAHFIIFERHEIGRDGELLELMRRAGVRCIIVGIESLADDNLARYDKRQSSRQVARSVESILAHDLHVIGTFVIGGDGDTPRTADAIVDFTLRSGISLNLFIMHDVEDDARRRLLIPLARRFRTWYQRAAPANTDFYDYATGNFVTYFPARMRATTLQRSVIEIYDRVFAHRQIARRVLAKNIFASLFGVDHGYAMRRTNQVIARIADDYYLPYLGELERGLYDADEQLIEERLAGLAGLPPPRPLADRVDLGSYRALTAALLVPGIVRLGLARLRALVLPQPIAVAG
jgi:hypothetical protein